MGPRVAFVLGGGGHAVAAEVGMLHALLDRDVRPELVVGTSVGALHGALVAAEPTTASVEKLEEAWKELAQLGVLGRSWFTDAVSLLRSRTHVRSNAPLRRLAERMLGVARSRSWRCRSSASPRRSSASASTGSARVRSWTRSSPR